MSERAVEESWRSLSRFHDFVKDRLESALQAGHELSESEFRVLRCLAEASGRKLRMRDVADGVGLSQSAASRLVGRLEANRGLVDRCLCDHDRRGVYTRLTDRGAELLDEAEATYAAELRSAWREAAAAGDLDEAPVDLSEAPG